MASEYAQILEEVLGTVLELQSFMFVEAGDPAIIEEPSSPLIGIDISFSGVSSGGLRLLAGRDLGIEMAANVLGVEPGRTPDRGRSGPRRAPGNDECGLRPTADFIVWY